MYIFVRTDLSKPQQVVQASHAAIESTKKMPYKNRHPNVVVLAVKNESKLMRAIKYVASNNIDYRIFVEENGEATAFATEVVSQDQKGIFKKYQLVT